MISRTTGTPSSRRSCSGLLPRRRNQTNSSSSSSSSRESAALLPIHAASPFLSAGRLQKPAAPSAAAASPEQPVPDQLRRRNEQSCSSSEISYGNKEQQQQQLDQYDHMGFNDQSYITTLYGSAAAAAGGAGQAWGSSELAPLEYDYEEIKQLITNPSDSNYIINSSSNTFVDDPTARNAARGKMMYF
ncbi:transcription factor MYB36-like [Iris pallida]|uniref:Transcription factor MYB36-like n=1 Tax=Iris pallida TaxID=29817 RepID=A0AAX6DKI1_IRIPA|nr:transcription factor MYB36-like [Iris pallida]